MKSAREYEQLPEAGDNVRLTIDANLQKTAEEALNYGIRIAHEDGLISEENVSKPEPETLRTAAAALAATYPPEDVSLYFKTLVSQDPDTWGMLAELTTDETPVPKAP